MRRSLWIGWLLTPVVLSAAVAQTAVVPLWPDGAPDGAAMLEADVPVVRAFLPSERQATGTGVVIFPGGGYHIVAMEHEGYDVAKWFNSFGVAAFVVNYRRGSDAYRHPVPLADALRSIRLVRAQAEAWGVDPQRIGVMGFSAGGHLAASTGVHFDLDVPTAGDAVDDQSSRPDFLILGYPVIAFDEPFAHGGSQRGLLGEAPDPELVRLMSVEKQVTTETPPAFLFHTSEDRGVPPLNSLAFYEALWNAGVPAELHVYQDGPHGIGLGPGVAVTETWPDRLKDWLRLRGLLAR